MAPAYEFFEHTADLGVRVYGSSLADLFRNAAAALYEALGRFEKTAEPRTQPLALEAGNLEDLLHDWLAELLYRVETEQVIYDRFESLAVRNRDRVWEITAELQGRRIDFSRSETHEEIKAVTYHQLRVDQLPNGTWRASVIFDV